VPDLVVVPTAGAVARSGWSRRDEALLVLDEGRLVVPDGTVLYVRSRRALAEVGRDAQVVSEGALAHGAGEGDEVHRSAVKVAAMLKLAVYADVAAFLKARQSLQRAVELTAPRRVRWLTDRADLAHAVRPLVADGLRLDVARVQLRTEGWRDRAIASLKRGHVDAVVRALSTLPDVRPVRRPTPTPRVLGVFDVRNEGMIANVVAVVRHCAERGDPIAAVYMERRVGRRIQSALSARVPVALASFGRPQDLVRAARIAGAVRRAVAAIVVDAGGDDAVVGPAARYAAGRLHAASVWQALVDLRAIRRSLVLLRPDVVLVASDAHRYARGYALAARELGVASAVLQHGALAFEHFYVPVVADRMLAWGPWCRDWFTERGIDTGRVDAVGCVRAPPRQPLRETVGSPQRWLFAAQPVPDAVTRVLLDRIQGALRAHPAARLIVRPHPGESRRGALITMLDAWDVGLRARVTVSPVGRSLADDLAASDVCLVSQSTVGIDALAAGVPVVLLTHDRVAEPIPFRAFDAVLVAASVSQASEAIASLGRSETLRGLAGGADAFLDAYLGPSGEAALEAARGALGAPGWAAPG
jgi:hypothetical protein